MDTARAARVLVVVADEELAPLVVRAVAHPNISVSTANNESTILAALTELAHDLVIVGGRIGRRTPLIVCDAVRLRRSDVPVLVMVGEETEDLQLGEHAARQLSDVQYLDVRRVANALDRGSAVRGLTLEMVGIKDTTEARAAWEEDQARAEAGPAPPPEPIPQDSGGATNPFLDPEAGPRERGPTTAETPDPGQLTREDLEFAERTIALGRAVNFRTPPPPAEPPAGVDRSTMLLRERVRELQRQLARLAFVHQNARNHLAETQGAVSTLQGQKQHFELEVQQLQAQLADKEARREQLAELLAQAKQDAADARDLLVRRDESTTEVLKQTQDALAELTSAQAQARHEHERSLAAEQARTEHAEAETAALRHELQEASARSRELSCELERFQAAGPDPQEASAVAAQQKERLEAALAAAQADAQRAREELAKRDQLHRSDLRHVEAGFRGMEAKWAERLKRLKEAMADFRTETDERTELLGTRTQELEVLKERLDGRQREVLALTEQQRETAKVLERERTRSVESVLDARLVAIEEFARAAADDLKQLVEVLSRVAVQETLLKRIQEGVTALRDAKTAVWSASALEEIERDHQEPQPRLPSLRQRWNGLSRWQQALIGGGSVAALVVLAAGLAAPWSRAPTISAPGSAAAAPPGRHGATARKEESKGKIDTPSLPLLPNVAEPATSSPPTASQGRPKAEATTAAEAPTPAIAALDAKPEANDPQAQAERKALRRQMFAAIAQKRWAEAADLGNALRSRFELDWEAEYNLADAYRRIAKLDEAVGLYDGFIERHRENKFIDQALLRAANLHYKLGSKEKAVTYYKRLAARPGSRYRHKAQQALRAIAH